MFRRSGSGLTALVAAFLLLALSACTATQSSQAAGSSSSTDDPEHASLTYWYWAESDAPGANNWMKARIAEYQALHPGVTVNLVLQSTDTLIGAFTTAAATKSGPDIATQWATIPVLSQAWAGAVTPISDLVPAAKTATWIGAQENTYQGKIWGMPLYVIGIPLAYNKPLFTKAGLTAAPTTFTELLSDCSALRKVGVTPIGAGNKDGYFGAWFFSNFGKQNLDNVGELQSATLGTNDITNPKYTGYLTALQQLQSAGCFNDDIGSLTLEQGSSKFSSGQAAMAWGTDGLVTGWAKTLGSNNVGVVTTPQWGTGKLANVYNTTQSSTAFVTSWSAHKSAAAQFLSWLHEPANLASWYAATGIFPADTAFSQSSLTTDLAKTLWKFDSTPGSVWLENYLPPSVDNDGDLVAGQVVTSGGTAAAGVAAWDKATQKWRASNPVEVKNYAAWAASK